MKLYIKLFNRKFDVSTSNSNVRRVYEMQLRIAKVQAEKDILKRAESELELVQAVGYNCQRVLGQTDDQIAEEEKEDPKK